MLWRNNGSPGMEVPAAQRSRRAITSRNPSTDNFPRPTSTSVPTTDLTMFRRSLSAVISNAHSGDPGKPASANLTHLARETRHILVFTSVCSLANDVKSSVCSKRITHGMRIIMIGTRNSVETCMRVVMHRVYPPHSDVAP